MFETEAELAITSFPFIIKEFSYSKCELKFIEEPKGLFGIPDLLLFNGPIIAIEFKLKNWKQAMRQAYRYKSFSEKVYVSLDKKNISKAKESIEMFVKFNIGLGAVDRNKIEFYYKSEMDKLYCYDLTKKALDLLN